MQLRDYRRFFQAKQCVSVDGLCGRIIRGTKPEDFLTLTDDPDRKLVMLMGPDGLEKIVGKTDYEALVEIGYEPNYIVRKVVDEGNQFKLVVFAEGGEAQLATWNNVAAIVAAAYPEAAQYLYRDLDALKVTPFADIERAAGFNFAEVDKAGPQDGRFMTFERFKKSGGGLVAARAFLYFAVHLRELFSGDGYTYDAFGNRGLMEYIVPNKPLNELGDYDLINMDVVVPGRPKKQKTGGRKNMKVHMLIIDPQNDFCDILARPGEPVGMALPGGVNFRATLPVPGANDDMKRVAALIDRIGPKLADIHVTMDSHRLVDIAHPVWWMDQNGNQPAPLVTIISVDDIENGIWTPRNPAFRKRTLEYARQLAANGKYQICIWPPHCLIGTWGHNVQAELNAALQKWSGKEFAMVDYVTKGSNPWTEHYGAVMAEVPDPNDPGTALNADFLAMLAEADIVAVAGEALSHCVKETVTQIADNIGPEHIKKFHILTDCTSPVPAVPNGPDFPQIAKKWLREMEARGMELTTSVEFLA